MFGDSCGKLAFDIQTVTKLTHSYIACCNNKLAHFRYEFGAYINVRGARQLQDPPTNQNTSGNVRYMSVSRHMT